MADIMKQGQRSRCMATIRSGDTKPGMVGRFLFSKGLRYRGNKHKLSGSPYIVLKKYKTVIFIDGCFWHNHDGCKYYRLPKTYVDFWRHKITMNVACYYSNNVYLKPTSPYWECEIKTKKNTLEA